ncbi:M48 metallopeptidase family protein [Spelaeicoccus albus]|uniref:YgjP-like metallopeptidase domain-containing protein n=1 Tax=Spelaeicoccus albus TaxID=1280376 RepID=A0A7Z0D3B7_9MICO|nr:M48 family metallopeptidase [Spelaeicoccus albus]NYI68109.1 hypothetical protein [Spelaeicoccus albus]
MGEQLATVRSADSLRESGLLEVRRSARRKKTVQARMRGKSMVLYVPDRLSRTQEDEWAVTMWNQIHGRRRARNQAMSDEALAGRARALSERYFDGAAVPSSVRWVGNQHTRWGSTSIQSGAIRLSDRLKAMPPWLTDSVLVHELAHLIEPSHNAAFRELVGRYPYTERSDAFLEGFSYGAGWKQVDGPPPE